jgi:hypothetical protein
MNDSEVFKEILSQSNDWYYLLEQKLSEYIDSVSLAIIGNNSLNFKSLDESKMTDKDFIGHLLNTQSKFNDVKKQLGLSKSLSNIDPQIAPGVTTRINQHTASMKSLEIDLKEEEDIFKRYILSGTITIYKFIFTKIIESLTNYNSVHNTNISMPRSWQ